MALLYFKPISVSALNERVDTNLDLSMYDILVCEFYAQDSDHYASMHGGREDHNPEYVIYGKDFGAGTSSFHEWWISNAAKDDVVKAMQIPGVSDTPYLDMLSHKICNITNPTAAQDAATKDYVDDYYINWTTWTPTLSWTGGSPGGTSYARYCQINKTVFFNFGYSVADPNAVLTALTVSLPVTPKNNSFYTAFTGWSYVGGVGITDIMPVNAQNTSVISFFNWRNSVDNQVFQLNVTGQYEVS